MPINFIETTLESIFGSFVIRVYQEAHGKETVVLFTQDLDRDRPVLVRVHSECLTGDTFGSLYCDCGEQLKKSLEKIDREGGVLIYLRQEGRGIGLFEKIKAYRLQREGLDTFAANIKLGHAPDERTYDMVKVVLEDLNISRIRLLTNNPDKSAALRTLGVEVVECLSLVIEPNEFNRRYMETKKARFTDHSGDLV